MKRFFTSDLHLGHLNIIRFCDRPYINVVEMNEDLVRRWNEVVGLDDEVWIVGDLAMGHLNESLFYVKEMMGHKYLLPGNHDRMFGTEGTKYADMVRKYTNAGIETVLDEQIVVRIDGWPFLVAHFPYDGESREGREDRYEEKRPVDEGAYLIHGHTHGSWRKRGRMVDVGVDAWGGYPVAFEEAVRVFASPEDHLAPLEWIPA